MCWNITAYIHSFRFSVFFGISKNIFQCFIIQMVFQFIGKIGVFGRCILWSPIEMIKVFPFFFESIAISSSCPKFRFFEIYSVNASINYPFNVIFFQIFQVIVGWHNIRYQMTMPYFVPIELYLPFIQMTFSIPQACKIVLVFTPSNSCHEMGLISMFTPRINSIFKFLIFISIGWIATNAINHRNVSSNIYSWSPGLSSLEHCFFSIVFFNY